MTSNLAPLLQLALASALALGTAAGHAESNAAFGSGGASASVRIRLVVEPMLRLLENRQSAWAINPDNGNAVAQQKIVIASNLRDGFCVDLSQGTADTHTDTDANTIASSNGPAWQITPLQASGAHILPTTSGYQVCGSRPGLYTLVLQHELSRAQALQASAAAGWIQTQLSSI